MRPYIILVDSNEGQPYTFQGIRGDAKEGNEIIEVGWKYTCLGRTSNSFGDYSIDGFVGRVSIERKSVDDIIGTVLGFERHKVSTRRERFEAELSNLANVPASVVIVEGTLDHTMESIQSWGTRTVGQLQKSFFRSVIALQQDYKVPWLWMPGRRTAEIAAFRWLDRFWQRNKGTEVV